MSRLDMLKGFVGVIAACAMMSSFANDEGDQNAAKLNLEVGKWTTYSDETGKAQSIVSIDIRDGRLYAKIEELLPPSEPDKVCTDCPDPFTDLPIAGIQIISGLVQKEGKWQDGKIFSPAKKRSYKAEVWLEGPNKLMVRGYMGFIYRTQEWQRLIE